MLSGDPNTSIHESKAFVCDVRAGRGGHGTEQARRHPRRAARRRRRTATTRRRRTSTMTELSITRAGRPADGLLHRHDGVHRLQGVRGGLQAVERPARPTAATFRKRRLLRQHRRARREHLAPRALRRAGRRRRRRQPRTSCRTCVAMAGAVDATRVRPRDFDKWVFMSDVCKHCTHAGCMDACPTGALIRTEFGTVVAPARRLQRLRLLHPVVPVRRRSTATTTTAAPPSARSVTTAWRTAWSRPAPRPARRTRSSSAPTRTWSTWRSGGWRRCTSAASRAPTCTARATREILAGGLGAFFLLTQPPERYGLPAHADSPIQENVVPATLAAVGAGLLAAAGVAAAFLRVRDRR